MIKESMKIDHLKNGNGDELENAQKVIMQFADSCSHSLRGPLKSIEGLTNLLLESKRYAEPNDRVFLDLIKTTIQKMERMLDELEHFLENSKRDVIPQPVDVREIISFLLDQLQDEITNARIDIHLKYDLQAPFYSDTGRLRLIFFNVLSNAIHFRDEKKDIRMITIKVSTRPENCVISIADNGIGIRPEHLPRIFELFFRGSEQSLGSGIGLYVVQETIKKMGGRIEVTTALGGGFEFMMTLPNIKPL